MKLEKSFIAILVAAIILAVPVASALQHRSNQLKVEHSKSQHLQIKVDSVQRQLDQKVEQQQKLEKDNADLKTQLQSKREAQAKLASVQATVTSPVAVKGNGSCESYRSALSQYSWNVEVAMNVMNAESGCFAGNDNPTDGHVTCMGSRGLFQIGCDSTNNYAGMFDATANIAQAHALYARRGWQPWGGATCSYKVNCY